MEYFISREKSDIEGKGENEVIFARKSNGIYFIYIISIINFQGFTQKDIKYCMCTTAGLYNPTKVLWQ